MRAIVPLDGSPLAEEALPIVEALALKPLKHVQLCRAVDKAEDRAETIDYLQGIAGRLRLSGLEVTVDAVVGRAEAAIGTAAAGSDVVIMATHGRGGFDRLRHGSVTQYALQELPLPILLVRAAGPHPEQKDPVAAVLTAGS